MTQILSAMLFVAAAAATPAPAWPTDDIPPAQRALFDLLDVEGAWEVTRGSPDCTIGLIDTGFDFFHPALRGSLVPGYVADGVYHTPAFSMIAHGTAMASLIVARPIEGEEDDPGIIGLAPGCRVIAASQGMPEHTIHLLRQAYMREHPDATLAEVQQEMMKHRAELQAFNQAWLTFVARTTSEAIRDLVDRDVRVISISQFFPRRTLASVEGAAETMDDAFAYAIDHDVVVVIGAGNTGIRVDEYPGDAETVLIAGASTLDDERWVIEVEIDGRTILQGSCTGPRLSVLAPTEDLAIARPHEAGFYNVANSPMGASVVVFDGPHAIEPTGATSSATAIVAALAALVRSAAPELSARETIQIIKQTAVDLGEEGFDEETGFGRIDFRAAVEATRTSPRR